MHTTMTTLLETLDSEAILRLDVIAWGSPVPSFGDPLESKVATLGLNPSNREFVDEWGVELDGFDRRFHTLRSLGIEDWSEVDASHLGLMIETCQNYFAANPYDRWFKKLDYIVQGADASFYGSSKRACHLDLIPYATQCKWTELTASQRSELMRVARRTLGLLLRDSSIEILILNGQSVVDAFQQITGRQLMRTEKPEWSLKRKTGKHVIGIGYQGSVSSMQDIQLGRTLRIFGFNHNLQSSYGVTNEVITSLRQWITDSTTGESCV